MIGKKEIIFVCHESSRTGAPIYLLSFVRWIKNNTDQPFSILIDKGGSLEDDFKALGATIILRPEKINIFRKIWFKINPRSYMYYFLKPVYRSNPGLIYINTFSTGHLSDFFKKALKIPIITHVHELENNIRKTGQHNIHKVIKNTDRFIAASEAVKLNLIENHKIDPDKIETQYSCIAAIPDQSDRIVDIEGIKKNEDNFLVGNAGMVDVLKGYEIFLETAHEVVNTQGYKQFKFIWVGAFGRGRKQQIDDYILKNSLQENVFFIGEQSSPISFYRSFDLFFISSHEDSFPLVMLENASLGNPVIGFKGTGGIEEFLSDFPGLLIEDINAHKAADRIIEIYNNRNRAGLTGEKLKKMVTDKYIMDNCGPVYFEFLEKNIK